MNPRITTLTIVCCARLLHGGELKLPHFRPVEIDSHIEIGYGITVADVDGDHKPDIVLVDKKQVVWYKNPTWEKFVIAENLTPLDDVCVAAADIDGDGKAEIAVGAQWNPGDTSNSGAVFYLVPPKDRRQKWGPIELPHEPTIHRMRWMKKGGEFELVVAPLHGRGNQNGEGAGVKILGYQKPADPHQPWTAEVINASLHLTHNFELLKAENSAASEMLVASKEGVFRLAAGASGWGSRQIVGPEAGTADFKGAGEVRMGKLADGSPFIATVEPMHGTQLAIYIPPANNAGSAFWKRRVLDDSLKEGHALACGDLIGNGSDQVVVGWRNKNNADKVGIKLFACSDGQTDHWVQEPVDDNQMACEDLCLADLNGDGKLDIIASGRATRNVKIYFNEGTTASDR